MKSLTIILLSMYFINPLFAQTEAIKIKHHNSEREIMIKENKRIRIETLDGQKISGRFRIEEGDRLFINGRQIALQNIAEIKRDPLLLSILTTGFLIYAGAITAGIGVIAGVFADPTAFLLTIPAAGMIYTGIKSPNFLRNYKMHGDWSLEIITISP